MSAPRVGVERLPLLVQDYEYDMIRYLLSALKVRLNNITFVV